MKAIKIKYKSFRFWGKILLIIKLQKGILKFCFIVRFSSCCSVIRKSCDSSCLVLSCHIGLEPTVWDSPVRHKECNAWNLDFVLMWSWVCTHHFISQCQNNPEIKTNSKTIHEWMQFYSWSDWQRKDIFPTSY